MLVLIPKKNPVCNIWTSFKIYIRKKGNNVTAKRILFGGCTKSVNSLQPKLLQGDFYITSRIRNTNLANCINMILLFSINIVIIVCFWAELQLLPKLWSLITNLANTLHAHKITTRCLLMCYLNEEPILYFLEELKTITVCTVRAPTAQGTQMDVTFKLPGQNAFLHSHNTGRDYICTWPRKSLKTTVFNVQYVNLLKLVNEFTYSWSLNRWLFFSAKKYYTEAVRFVIIVTGYWTKNWLDVGQLTNT